MKILKMLLSAVAVLAIVFVVVGLFLPATATMSRQVVIEAPPSAVFPLVNDLRAMRTWAPWYERDPDAVYRYDGAERGVGARVAWQSDHPEVGSGSQEIIESRVDEYVRTSLDFGAQGQAEAWFALAEVEAGTEVTWGFVTDFGNNLLGRYFGLVIESMLAPDYEAGLARLKSAVEGGR